jgi:hypothetical protein
MPPLLADSHPIDITALPDNHDRLQSRLWKSIATIHPLPRMDVLHRLFNEASPRTL